MLTQNFPNYWRRVLKIALGLGVACLLFSSPAWAQLTDYKTVVTFNAPIEVPGSTPQVLPAGTYTFKVVDSQVDRNIVQISNERESHVFTTILAVPTHRDVETSRTVMTFEERAAGVPQALRAWFAPFERSGQEFVYSKGHGETTSEETELESPIQ